MDLDADKDKLMQELKRRLHETCDFAVTRTALLMENLAVCDDKLFQAYIENGIRYRGYSRSDT